MVQNPMRALAPADAGKVRRRLRDRQFFPRGLRDRQAAAKRADPRRHARRRGAAGRRQHDPLGQRADCASGAAGSRCWGANFFTALGSPEILGPDFCPFHTALATGQSTSSTLRSQDSRYFQVHAAPVREFDGPAAAPDRHRPRRHPRSPAAAEARGHPPGRHGAGRPRRPRNSSTCRSRTASSC